MPMNEQSPSKKTPEDQPNFRDLLRLLMISKDNNENGEENHTPESVVSSDSDERGENHENFDKVVKYLEGKAIKFEPRRDESIIKTGFEGNNGTYATFFDIKEDKNLLIIYSFSSIKIPEHKRLLIAEYLTRANYGIMTGNFEMDFRDGEVRYKASVHFADSTLSDAMIENLLEKSLSTLDTYFPGLMRVTYSNESAASVIMEIESGRPNAANAPVEAVAVRVLSEGESQSGQ